MALLFSSNDQNYIGFWELKILQQKYPLPLTPTHGEIVDSDV